MKVLALVILVMIKPTCSRECLDSTLMFSHSFSLSSTTKNVEKTETHKAVRFHFENFYDFEMRFHP